MVHAVVYILDCLDCLGMEHVAPAVSMKIFQIFYVIEYTYFHVSFQHHVLGLAALYLCGQLGDLFF